MCAAGCSAHLFSCLAEPIGSSFREAQDVVGADAVIVAQGDQVMDGHFLLSTLVLAHLVPGGT